MAPFDNPPSSSLKTKISPLIEGQLPDFVRDDHPLFTKFIEYYYQYLEAAELVIVAQVDNVIQETLSLGIFSGINYIHVCKLMDVLNKHGVY